MTLRQLKSILYAEIHLYSEEHRQLIRTAMRAIDECLKFKPVLPASREEIEAGMRRMDERIKKADKLQELHDKWKEERYLNYDE